MPEHKIGTINEVPEGTAKQYKINGVLIGVFHVNGKWFAIGDVCTHKGGLLHEGPFDEYTVTCPVHAAQFDLKTGQNVSPPAPSPVKAYKIYAKENELFIEG